MLRDGNAEYMHVENARNDSVKVVRDNLLAGSDDTMLAFMDGQIVMMFKLPYRQGVDYINKTTNALASTFQNLGVGADEDETGRGNDVSVNGKKITGTAMYKDVSAPHFELEGEVLVGTMIMNTDVQNHLFDYFNLPDSKFDGKQSDGVGDRVGTLKNHVDVSNSRLIDEIVKEWKKEFDSFVEGTYEDTMTRSEKDRAQKILEKQTERSWVDEGAEEAKKFP